MQIGEKITSSNIQEFLSNTFITLIKQKAQNIDSWRNVPNMFKPGDSATISNYDFGGWRHNRSYIKYTVKTQWSIVPLSTVTSDFNTYIEDCLQAYPITDNILTFKSMLWLFNCSLIFLTTKLKGVRSSYPGLENTVVIFYDPTAQVVIPSINNEEVISNPYYDPTSEDSLINCFNENLRQALKDQYVENYSSKEDLTTLLSNFTRNLKNTISTTTMEYTTSAWSSSCCSSSCCSSSWFLAYTA